jgi:hypothetical protein
MTAPNFSLRAYLERIGHTGKTSIDYAQAAREHFGLVANA